LVFVSRFFPRLADRIARRKVRKLFRDEIAARHAQKTAPVDAPREDAPTILSPRETRDFSDKGEKIAT
jgi:hypothetical protein